MSAPTPEFTVDKITAPDELVEVNDFFNRGEIKQGLHTFTYRPTLERAVERDDRRIFSVRDSTEQLIGAVMVWCESRVLDQNESQIRLIAVDPDYRGVGLGRQLAEQAESFAQQYGMRFMSADVAKDAPAVEFWKNCGYSIAEQWTTDSGRGMLRVTKPLPQ